MTDLGVDLKLKKNAEGIYDLVIAENGDLESVDSFETALLMSVYAEKRADESQAPVAQRRRGWIGNAWGDRENFEMGSLLWLLEQARLTTRTLNEAITFFRDGLQWLVDDGHLIKIDVDGIRTSTNVVLTAVLFRSASVSETFSFELWNNTTRIE